ncbi:PF01935 domain protein [Propionibacterium freudenreichii]|nr:PF01935 domain protein [Propionibacterium freudenreichii]SCC97482.1 PF01935 domain protein [Propionibacterium freudenreichii]
MIGRVIDVRSTALRVALDVGSKGFTKVGPSGLQTVGVVNSYIVVPAGAHRVVGIVTGVYINGRNEPRGRGPLLSQDDIATYELEATIVGRFEGDTFKSGLTGYPPLHAPVQVATPNEVKNIFLPKGRSSLRIGTSAVAAEQAVHLDANLLLGHHCAVVGSTGSGKSCTVTAVIDGLLDHEIPNGHIVVFDINGEYSQAFGPNTPRGKKTRPLVLGPKPGISSGLFLPHWFMNNEEHLNLLRASEGVQAPVLQRAIADARLAGSTKGTDADQLDNVRTTLVILDALAKNTMNSEAPAAKQLRSLAIVLANSANRDSPIKDNWVRMSEAADQSISAMNLRDNVNYQLLTAQHRDELSRLTAIINGEVTAALNKLGLGSGNASADFDAPVFYSLQALCDQFLPNRVQLEQAVDNRIGQYVATLQMRLSRLLADGRYDFITRVEQHSDPLGSYLKALMGVDPTGGNPESDWPAAASYQAQAEEHGCGPSVTIFDLSQVANDVLENITALLGRILFDFAVRSQPRAEHPVMLVLEEAHRFIPARNDPSGSSGRSAAVFERIAKEGRKFGLSLLLASQRPSELSETVVAQCGTVIAHRLTHEADQGLLRHATALSSRALLDQLPSLAQQHALVTGVSTGVPVAVRVRDVVDPPKSDDPNFIATWNDAGKLADLPGHIDRIVKEWQGELP